MSNKLFEQDEDTKKMLQEISATFGVKSEIVKECWEYTIFVMLLNIASNEKGIINLKVPYIGTIGLRNNGTMVDEKGEAVPDIESFISISDNFKKLFQKVQHGSYADLSNYLQHKYIEPIVDNIEES